ncbi:MAG TPA: sigma-70 family RNA polymerase sigma factor [Thermoanaerobaculia bacterium]|nr:sigma-70 family RNA polymerase sigma factor [Thermoanaerobaculia bacterium]
MSVRPDADLVQAAQAGDVESFEALYARYVPVVHSIVLGRLPAVDADDVTQNVFITAYKKLTTLREPAAFAGWITRIARNAAEDHRRRTEVVVVLDTEYAARATQADAAEAARALSAIRALPEAYRQTLMLRLVEGLSGPEIAERTGLTHGSVRVNLHRGMQLLRDALDGGDA